MLSLSVGVTIMETTSMQQTTLPHKPASSYQHSNLPKKITMTVKKEMRHMLRRKSLVRPSCTMALAYLIGQGSYRVSNGEKSEIIIVF